MGDGGSRIVVFWFDKVRRDEEAADHSAPLWDQLFDALSVMVIQLETSSICPCIDDSADKIHWPFSQKSNQQLGFTSLCKSLLGPFLSHQSVDSPFLLFISAMIYLWSPNK